MLSTLTRPPLKPLQVGYPTQLPRGACRLHHVATVMRRYSSVLRGVYGGSQAHAICFVAQTCPPDRGALIGTRTYTAWRGDPVLKQHPEPRLHNIASSPPCDITGWVRATQVTVRNPAAPQLASETRARHVCAQVSRCTSPPSIAPATTTRRHVERAHNGVTKLLEASYGRGLDQ